MTDIVAATREYEQWLRQFMPLDADDLAFKHEQMRTSCFPFLRATYYRWAQVFPKACEDLAKAPKVLAVGDLHAENFGTWRDAEGRLVWGVNDFDEAVNLPYTNDLVRLAASIELAIDENHMSVDIEEACDALLKGYRKTLEAGGQPMVLAEDHGWLRRMASSELRHPVRFWQKMDGLPAMRKLDIKEGKTALLTALPESDSECQFKSRRAGLGSLGKPRYLALTEWCGGRVAREAKALSPSGAAWANGGNGAEIHYAEAMSKAVRCQDPFSAVKGTWLIRRLAPDCSRIELSDLPAERDELKLIEAMGKETANIHLGSSGSADAIAKHLKKLPKSWLEKAGHKMAKEVRSDYDAFK